MCDACRSEADDLDARRERIYELLAALLTSPDAGEWGRATRPGEQARDVAAADALREEARRLGLGEEADDLDLRGLMVELCQPLGHLQAEYDRFFVRSRRTSHSPLELAHRSPWVRRHPERGVDELSRTYDEAGLPDREGDPSRPDHAARELGFMAWLIAQSRFGRRMACLGAADAEEALGCDLAQRDFFGHHLAGWLPELAARLRDHEGGGFPEQLGRFLAAWIILERRRLDAEPPRTTSKAAGARRRRAATAPN